MNKEQEQIIVVLSLKYGSLAKALDHWRDGMIYDSNKFGRLSSRNDEFNKDELELFNNILDQGYHVPCRTVSE